MKKKKSITTEDAMKHPLYPIVEAQIEKELNKALLENGTSLETFLPRDHEKINNEMFIDELLYGVSGCHVSNQKIEKLSVSEIMERFGDLLTESEIQKLKEHENKFKQNEK